MTLEEKIARFSEMADQILKDLDRISQASALALPKFGQLLEVVNLVEADLLKLSALTNQPVDELRGGFITWFQTIPFKLDEAMEHVKARAALGLPLPWEEPNEQSTLQSPHA